MPPPSSHESGRGKGYSISPHNEYHWHRAQGAPNNWIVPWMVKKWRALLLVWMTRVAYGQHTFTVAQTAQAQKAMGWPLNGASWVLRTNSCLGRWAAQVLVTHQSFYIGVAQHQSFIYISNSTFVLNFDASKTCREERAKRIVPIYPSVMTRSHIFWHQPIWNIASAVFYNCSKYSLPLPQGGLHTLAHWYRAWPYDLF